MSMTKQKNSNLMKWNTLHGSIGMTSLGCLPCKMYLIYATFTLGLVGNHVVKWKDNEQIKMTKGTSFHEYVIGGCGNIRNTITVHMPKVWKSINSKQLHYLLSSSQNI